MGGLMRTGSALESLVSLCLRVNARASEAHVAHLRTWSGNREVDLIVERGRETSPQRSNQAR